MIRVFLALAALVAAGSSPGLAQSTVRTVPFGAVSGNLSTTITATGVFQSVQTANSERKNCLIQNNSTHNMNVYFGPIASATAATSVVLSPGFTVNCTAGGVVLTDQVSITGTITDVFLANFQ